MPNTSPRRKTNGSAVAAKAALQSDTAMIKEDVHDLRDDLRATMIDLRGFLTGKASASIDKGQLLAKGAGKRIASMRDDVEQTVRSRPLATLGTAFGIGLLTAMLARRR